jgi:hypothetical protein
MPTKQSKHAKRFCVCCQQLVSACTEYRHRQLQAPPRLKASSPYLNWSQLQQVDCSNAPQPDVDHTFEGNDPSAAHVHELEVQASTVVNAAMSNAAKSWSLLVDEDGQESDEDSVPGDEDENEELLGQGLSGSDLWDEFGETFEREVAAIGECKF